MMGTPLGKHKKSAKPKEILKLAHELLSQRGRWAKGTWVTGLGMIGTPNAALEASEYGCKFCPEGAIYACATDRPAAENAIRLVENEMRRQGFEEDGVPSLNDKSKTTKKTMLGLLGGAARG